jgi:hypothetical protein
MSTYYASDKECMSCAKDLVRSRLGELSKNDTLRNLMLDNRQTSL